ncbi:MAG: hypothetical protein HY075_02720 [Deltaproteobacteria bacterium]|nr:hypothetical protein [Deltaproteobacteria bacterium]
MKTVILSVAACLSLVTAAHARSPMPPVWSADLTHVDLDEQLPYKNQVESASITLDYAKGTATLVMPRRFYCPPRAMCAQMMPMPIVVSLPIVERLTDACGSRIVHAKLDRRPVDGTLQSLSVRDNRSNRCPTFAALEATEVVYKTQGYHRVERREIETRSTFSGDALRPVYVHTQNDAE